MDEAGLNVRWVASHFRRGPYSEVDMATMMLFRKHMLTTRQMAGFETLLDMGIRAMTDMVAFMEVSNDSSQTDNSPIIRAKLLEYVEKTVAFSAVACDLHSAILDRPAQLYWSQVVTPIIFVRMCHSVKRQISEQRAYVHMLLNQHMRQALQSRSLLNHIIVVGDSESDSE